MTAPGKPTEPEPERPLGAPVLERLRAGAARRAAMVDRLFGALLLAAIAGTAAFLLGPGLFAQRIPWTDDSLGTIATATIKADRDYDIPDEETTRRMREEAVAAVRAVWVQDPAALEVTRRRIDDGFATARAHLQSEPGVPEEKLRRKEPRADEGQRRLEQLQPARDEIEAALEVRLDDAEFEALAQAGFSETVQLAVSQLVSRAMRERVVADREELAQHRSKGVTVVRGRVGAAFEEVVAVEAIRDLSKVREAVETEAGMTAEANGALRKAIGGLARREIRVNMIFDPDETRRRREDAAEGVKPVVIQLKKGERIIGDGERIVPRHLLIFRHIREQSRATDLVQVRVGGALLAALLVLSLFSFARASLPKFRPSRKDALLLAATLASTMGLVRVALEVADALRDRTPEIPLEAYYFAIPFAAGAMLIRFVLGAEAALVFAAAFAPIGGFLASGSLTLAAYALAGSVVGAARTGGVRDRGGLFRAGAWAGLVQACLVVCFALFGGRLVSWDVVASVLAAFLGGAVVTPLLVVGGSMLAESVLGYTTDIQLLELANLNHPALKELIVQAPGTYHHSIIVGTVVEQAAEEVGANALLAKVCAYYHDLGKGKNPLSFGENQKGDNRHDRLTPEESAKLIVQHVADGLEIARKFKLPAKVAAAIPEHHGTRLVGFFFHKALKAHEKGERTDPPEPQKFRYAGPRPQSRETALVMLADAAEAASRAMPDPTPKKLEELVGNLIRGIYVDGQLDDCELSLRDLATIQQSFCRTLEGIYHSRPDYPAAAKGSQSQLTGGLDKPAEGEGKPDEKRLLN